MSASVTIRLTSYRDRLFWIVVHRIIQLSSVVMTSFTVAFVVACAAMDSPTPTFTPMPGPTPIPTISAADVAAHRLASLLGNVPPTRDPAIGGQFNIMALTAESEAMEAEAILKNTSFTKSNWFEVQATATNARKKADTAIATATAEARIFNPGSLATEVTELESKYATQEVEDAYWRRRAGNCLRALDIRSDVATAESWYAKRDVSVGELSVFHPAEATARAVSLKRASELCP